jgi:probable rRNA maturation factor
LEGVKKSCRINVCFLGDKKIAELNRRFFNKTGATDVISFELSDNQKEILADIAVSAETAVRQSKIYRTSPADETLLYVIHGLLHICGYDDKSLRQRKIMREKAELILHNL